MAIPDKDTVYTSDANRTVYTRESSGTGWFVGIIVVLALLAIGYLVFSANNGSTTVNTTNNPTTIESPVTTPAPLTQAPATTDVAPSVEAPAAAAPADAPAASTAPAAEPAV